MGIEPISEILSRSTLLKSARHTSYPFTSVWFAWFAEKYFAVFTIITDGICFYLFGALFVIYIL